MRRWRTGASRQRKSPRSKAPARWRRREAMKLILVRHGRPDEGDAATPNDPPLHAKGGVRLARRRSCLRAKASRASSRARCCARSRRRSRLPSGSASPSRRSRAGRRRIVARAAIARRKRCAPRAARPGRGFSKIRSAISAPIPANSARASSARWRRPRGADRAARIVVFTHGLPINVVLSHALGLDSITTFLVGYGSVTRLRRREDGGYGVSSINETGHHRFEIPETNRDD